MPQNSKMTTPSSDQRLGLRERKKLKTRKAIQENAFRLFAEQGYEATTVEQIAEAAEVSPSTFFRYFPTKEDVVLEDDYDPLIFEILLGQPAGLSPLEAVRRTTVSLIRMMSPEEQQAIYQRVKLSMDVPALRARQWESFEQGGQVIASALARRTGRPDDDFELRALTMALMGAQMIALLHWAETGGTADFAGLLDKALAILARGGELDQPSGEPD
jgi:AcrR family transcriptional regulator